MPIPRRYYPLLARRARAAAAAAGEDPRMFIGLGSIPGAPIQSPADGALYAGSANYLGCHPRCPSAVRAANGDLLLFSQWLTDVTIDQTSIVLAVSRSTDNGRTWSAPQKIVGETTDPANYTIGNVCPVVSTETGRVIIVYYRNHRTTPNAANNSIWAAYSDDHGATWSAPTNISSQVRVEGAGSPAGHTWPATAWDQTVVGPHAGVCLPSGPYAGRCIISGYHRLTAGGTPYPHAMYTTDGVTWSLSNGTHNAANNNQIEPAIVLLSDLRVMMNCRNYAGGSNQRKQLISSDGGANFADAVAMAGSGLPAGAGSNGCQGSLAKLGSRLLLACGDNPSFRHRLGIWQSTDDGANWSGRRIVTENWCAYSAMIPLSTSELLLLFEGGHSGANTANGSWAAAMYCAYINLEWLTGSQPMQAVHYFNERAAGLASIPGEATANVQAMSLADVGATSRINHNLRAQPRTNVDVPLYGASKDAGQSALVLDSGVDYVALSHRDSEGTPTAAIWAYMPNASEEWTYEVILTPAAAVASTAIFRTASSGKRVTIDLDAAGKVVFRLDKGTGAVQGTDYQTLTSAAAIHDGATHHIACRRKSPGTMELTVDGVTTSVADPTWATDLRTVTEVRLGCDHSGTSQFQGTIEQQRLTKGYVADGQLWTKERAKSSQRSPTVYSNPLLAGISNLKLWLPTDEPELWFGDWYATTPRSRANLDKIGVGCCFDQAAGNHWRSFRGAAMSPSRAGVLVWDSVLGWVYEAGNEPAPTGSLGCPLVRPQNTLLDFIQEGGAFTIGLAVYIAASTGASQVLFDNSAASGVNPGFALFATNANPANLTLQISRNGSSVYSQTATAALPRSQWHMLLIRSAGAAQNVEWFVRRIDTNTTPGSATVRGTAPSASTTGTVSTQACCVGSNAGNWTGSGGSFTLSMTGRVALPFAANSALTDQQVADYFTRLKEGVNRP